ncbi:MAG: tetratricopeptide repeat protein [Alphaproteobacteria bacterium]|nr:tetratricopeptide repeat protein [Alphaproteobacteria bacterium]
MSQEEEQLFQSAHALWASGEAALAVPVLEALCLAHPENPGLFSALGVCLYESGDARGAQEPLEQALKLDPEQGVAAYNLAHVLLTLGEEERGLALYERRWSSFSRPAWHPALELSWDGKPLEGTLLVLAEQGFGDMIQFARFLPLAAQYCNKLILVVPPELKRLLSDVPGVAQVVSAGEALPAFDRFVMMMSLPYRLGAFGLKRPYPPYLKPLHQSLEMPPASKGRDIGLIWSGRADSRHQKARALDLSLLGRHLGAARDVVFHCLQLGEAASQLPDWTGPAPLIDRAGEMTDFAATAALLQGLDLLITVDTASAHLAGALGMPAFVLLPVLPHWVWGLEGEVTGWYPSLRLFRADEQGWTQALMKLSQALSERVDSRPG